MVRVCDQHADRFDCADALIHRRDSGRHGIIIHDGGTSILEILVCPWCGSDLHDGSVDAFVCGSDDREDVRFDLAPTLATVSDEALVEVARADWKEDAVRGLLDLVASANEAVAAELAAFVADEAWWGVNDMEAELWLRRQRPHLIEAVYR